MKILDISEHQGTVDWEALARQHAAGTLGGVILRAGHGQTADRCWQRNAAEANRVGVPIGAYWFSEAVSAAEAAAEAETFLRLLEPWRIELPVAYDLEDWTITNRFRPRGVEPAKALCTAMVRSFCEACEAAGYYTMLYTGLWFSDTYYNKAELFDRFDLWWAQYPYTAPDVTVPPRPCGMWQWGGSEVDGITPGVKVDTNEAYRDYPALIRGAGLNRLLPEREEPENAVRWAAERGWMTEAQADTPVRFRDLARIFYAKEAEK